MYKSSAAHHTLTQREMFSLALGTSVDKLEVEAGDDSATLMGELVGQVPKMLSRSS